MHSRWALCYIVLMYIYQAAEHTLCPKPSTSDSGGGERSQDLSRSHAHLRLWQTKPSVIITAACIGFKLDQYIVALRLIPRMI